ncbi:hypothetical protein C2E23DRAFT_859948 [Lenzites betulinus]|nr:hypothetical protein C2E23DRAFT_859948 [Lenzites betulinus]
MTISERHSSTEWQHVPGGLNGCGNVIQHSLTYRDFLSEGMYKIKQQLRAVRTTFIASRSMEIEKGERRVQGLPVKLGDEVVPDVDCMMMICSVGNSHSIFSDHTAAAGTKGPALEGNERGSHQKRKNTSDVRTPRRRPRMKMTFANANTAIMAKRSLRWVVVGAFMVAYNVVSVNVADI